MSTIIIDCIMQKKISTDYLALTCPHPGQGGEFSLFGMADLPQGSGYWIAKVRMRNTNSSCAATVRGVQYSAVP